MRGLKKMWNQKTLFKQVLETPKTKTELDAVCCESCYTASEPKCDCRCHGAYHGLGRLNKREEKVQAGGEHA